MRWSLMLVVAATIACLLLGRAAPALAAPAASLAQYKPAKPRALAHFEAGNRAYKDARIATRPLAARVRDLRRAIDEYTAGQAIEDAAAFDYNIAHCARQLVDNATAVAHLQRFLERAEGLDVQLREAVQNEIAELDSSGAIRAQLRQGDAPPPGERKAPPPDPPASPPPAAPSPAPTSSAAPGVSLPAAPAASPLGTSAATEPRASHVWAGIGWGLTAAGVVGGGVTAWLAIGAAGLDSDANDTRRATSNRLDLQHQADSRRRAAERVNAFETARARIQ